MKRRQIFIELTSLLDVILIMLFILLMQAKNTTAEAMDTAAAAESNTEQVRAELIEAYAEQDALKAEIDAEAARADAQAEELLARLRSGEMPEEVQREGDTFRWSSPISDTQCLEVEVLLKEDTYTVLRWQAVSTVEWEQAPGGQVWSGGEEKKEESP